MEPTVWIYFSKTGTGYELKGSDVISGFDAFINTDGTYMVEYACLLYTSPSPRD
jgi:hypothetical protein